MSFGPDFDLSFEHPTVDLEVEEGCVDLNTLIDKRTWPNAVLVIVPLITFLFSFSFGLVI